MIIFYFASTLLLLIYLIRGKEIEKRISSFKEKVSLNVSYNLGISEKAALMFFGSLFYLIEAVSLVLFIQFFYVGNFKVPTSSMEPLMKPNDRYLTDMVSYKFISPKREEIIIFK